MNGKLDNATLMRIAHIDRSCTAGGVEQYLNSLNRRLLHRNKMAIIQMYLTEEDSGQGVETERVGKGRLIWVPVPVRTLPRSILSIPERLSRLAIRRDSRRSGNNRNQNHGLITTLKRLLSNR